MKIWAQRGTFVLQTLHCCLSGATWFWNYFRIITACCRTSFSCKVCNLQNQHCYTVLPKVMLKCTKTWMNEFINDLKSSYRRLITESCYQLSDQRSWKCAEYFPWILKFFSLSMLLIPSNLFLFITRYT